MLSLNALIVSSTFGGLAVQGAECRSIGAFLNAWLGLGRPRALGSGRGGRGVYCACPFGNHISWKGVPPLFLPGCGFVCRAGGVMWEANAERWLCWGQSLC